MPRKKRIWYPDATYHVMSRGNRRTAIFQNYIDYVDFLEYFLQIKEMYSFKVHAICLMTNHFHVCLQTVDTELWRITGMRKDHDRPENTDYPARDDRERSAGSD